MDFPVSTITRPIVSKLVALQSFFFARPRLDVDLKNTPEDLYGQRSLGASPDQNHLDPIPIYLARFEFEFYWNFKLRIKNNSSKTAYNIRIEDIYKPSSYLEKIDDIASLQEDEIIELDYKLRYRQAMTGNEANDFLRPFPGHLEKLTILVSYTNEGRIKFYTRFIGTKTSKTNEHLLRKPKTTRV